MKRGIAIGVTLLALAAALGAGYWLGQHRAAPASQMGATSSAGKKILFYRNPMGLPDTSPTPKKDPMGMDYIPVYEGGQDTEPGAADQIRISAGKVQKLGVRTEAAQTRMLSRVIRSVGRVEIDERRLVAVAPKFEGWIERLHVNITGQQVAKGQPLFEVYSPELVSAQREYAIAAQGSDTLKGGEAAARESMGALAEASLTRLKNWDISEAQIKELARRGETRRTLTFRAPVSGVVMEKKALQGMRFGPGETLYQIADLASVWLVADVYEQEIGLIQAGQKVKVTVNAYPGKLFEGTVAYVYPTLKPDTRTAQVRIELANPGGQLKPGMFATMELAAAQKSMAVTVPNSAVIDSGTRQLVLVQAAEGRFEPRTVRLGVRSDEQVEILDGVQAGEQVVVSANFLIDAESNLKAAVAGFGAQKDTQSANRTAHEGHAAAAPGAGHRGVGRIAAIDAASGEITLAHQPIASLKWPAMTMDFVLANPSLAKDLKPGMQVEFEFVERKPGEWVITSLHPTAGSGSPAQADPHAGH